MTQSRGNDHSNDGTLKKTAAKITMPTPPTINGAGDRPGSSMCRRSCYSGDMAIVLLSPLGPEPWPLPTYNATFRL